MSNRFPSQKQLEAEAVVAAVIALIMLFALGIILTSFFVWLAWNVLGVNAIFGLPELGFLQVVGIAVLINILFGIFRGGK